MDISNGQEVKEIFEYQEELQTLTYNTILHSK